MEHETVQINFRLPASDAARLKSEVVKMNVDMGAYIQAALNRFKGVPIESRRVILEGFSKRVGRKVKL